MRPSDDIRKDINACRNSNPGYAQNLQAEMLLDIRDLLTELVRVWAQPPGQAISTTQKPSKNPNPARD